MDGATSLLLLKFGLPLLLGYTLFVASTGQTNPIRMPRSLALRPAWFLGCWAAAAVAIVATLGIQFALMLPAESAPLLLQPALLLLAVLLLPGMLFWALIRRHVHRALANIAASPSLDDPMISEPLALPAPENGVMADDQIQEDHEATVVETWQESLARVEAEAVAESLSDLAMEAEAYTEDRQSVELPVIDLANLSAGSHQVAEAEPREQLNTALEHLESAREELDYERNLREQTERHLQVTRRALSVLEAETRDYESRRADTVLSFEQELESRIREAAAASSKANKEHAARVAAESSVVDLKQKLALASHKIRKNTEARAKALETANKAMSMARESVQTRRRLEIELTELKSTLADRQTTISSLIRTLEKEKQKTEQDVMAQAKQLVLHERQMRARRSLDEVSRSIEDNLTTRLVKKVARSLPSDT